MRYLIHTCPDRKWYVDEFLVPSMKAQGLDNIDIWYDKNRKGNLVSWVESCEACGKLPGGTWHLQDDVIISRKFAEQTKKYDGEEVVCGFVNEIFGPNASLYGEHIPAAFMWNSFQCIYIPNHMAKEFVEWFRTDDVQTRHQIWVAGNKFDDSFFSEFFHDHYDHTHITNIKPCIVDHIDYLLGGSVINRWRGYYARAAWWEDDDLVEQLEKDIAETTP